MKTEEIRQELLSLVRERGLDFGIVVRRIGSPGVTLSRDRDFMFAMPGEERRPKLKPLTEAYKVFPDGREELIRKAVLLGLSASSFREIAAASDALTPHHTTLRLRMNFPFLPLASWGRPRSSRWSFHRSCSKTWRCGVPPEIFPARRCWPTP